MSDKPKAKLKLDWCSHDAALLACKRWHYSKCVPAGKTAKVGVWEDGVFVGVIIFSPGATRALVKQYGLTPTEGCELTRVALKGHRTPVSRMIRVALIFIRQKYPKLKLVVSFADTEQGHHGGIYQAGGWLYTGKSNAADEYLYKGKRWHGRSFRASHPGKEKDPGVVVVKGSRKHRYLMPLTKDMKEKIKKLAQPYPKK